MFEGDGVLGILQVIEEKSTNKITTCEILIENVKFFEIIVYIKNKSDHFISKILINNALKKFKKRNIKKICAKKEFNEYFENYGLQFVEHFEIFYAKRFEILKMLDKKCIFVHSKRDISDMIDFIAQNYDDIFLDIYENYEKTKDIFLEKYGISTMKFNSNYKRDEGVFVCFDKPKNCFYGEILLNFSKEELNRENVFDIVCETELYSGNTDCTAVCSALVSQNFNLLKNIKIKNFLINT